ncbi:MAG: hypothetical protein MJ110_04020 [Lachnospiraceae bacterium]|nr:hypothetical protein [Lachnospiraceae bacterium]
MDKDFESDIKYIKECLDELEQEGIDYNNCALIEGEFDIDTIFDVGDDTVYNKKKLMQIFGWADSKMDKFLRLMYKNGYATKLGKSYVMTKDQLIEFIDMSKGRELKLPNEYYDHKKYFEEKQKERKKRRIE